MNPVRFAILGAGGIAVKFKNAADLTEGAEVVAVGSKSAERAAAFAEKNHIPRWYDNYETMLEDPEIDAVYIATTHNFHMENIRACIAAGKHILCEKPLVLTEAEAEEAFQLAAEKGVFLMEAMWSRFLPHLRKAYGSGGRLCTPAGWKLPGPGRLPPARPGFYQAAIWQK